MYSSVRSKEILINPSINYSKKVFIYLTKVKYKFNLRRRKFIKNFNINIFLILI